jgi:hypothetical protein
MCAQALREENLLKAVERAIEEKQSKNQLQSLRQWRTHLNLANLGFDDVWERWYAGQVPPKLEVDLLCVFPDVGSASDEVLLIGVEMKHFDRFTRGNFFSGFDQVLAFSLFGFDGLSLWHLFSGDIDEGIVIGHSSGASEIVERYRLPLFYLAATVGDDLQDLQFTSFHPAETSGDIAYYLEWMWNHARDRRNPLLDSDDVKKRRRTIKAMLKIP